MDLRLGQGIPFRRSPLYRPLWRVPPGSKHYSWRCRKNIPNQVIKWSRCERYNNHEEVARKATRAVFSISPSLLFIHVPTMPAYILHIYAGFSLRIQVAEGRRNIAGEYFERGFTSEYKIVIGYRTLAREFCIVNGESSDLQCLMNTLFML